MSRPEQIPSELVWTSEGHLTDVAMTAIADGEEAILPGEAFGHLGACELCVRGVDRAASLSTAVTHALASPEPERARRAFPVLAVAAVIALSALTALPSLGAARESMVQLYRVLPELLPILIRSITTLAKSASRWIPLLSLASAMLLFVTGWSVARLAPRMVER